ncbi:APC family permease [Qipengyuania zhejiangensis]|uniref:APC family permease n=1 Tax=Qipengyuania zhejiangensis TaxID=3077782 RepID=UPI002D78693B|nr:APC family permease [Qipengyuania sp. Z2]
MPDTQELPRTIGFLGTALFPINGMIGAGIFALPAIMVAAVGNFAPWMMLFGALLILPLTFVFSTLATRFDRHGGPVLYAHAAFGPFAGFQAGWSRYASGVVAVAANTQVAVAYLGVLFPVLNEPAVKASAVVGFIVFTTIVNLVGMRASVKTLGVMTAIKILPLIGLVVIGLATHDPAVGFSLPQFSELESVVLLTFYAYMAFENGTFAAGELRNPKRDVPLALMTTLAAVALLYMAVIWAYLAISPTVDGNESALSAAAGELMGQAGIVAISVAAAFSIGANTLSGGIVTPRMTFGMAEQGTLPRAFSHISKRFQTPDVSILFYGAAAILFSLWAGFATLAIASTLSRLVMYLLSALALPVLENRDEHPAPRWHLAVALLAAISTFWVASQASAEAYKMLGLILVVGTGLYFLAVRANRPVQ